MDSIIKKIVEIDKNALKIKEEGQKIIRDSEKNLNIKLKDLEREELDKGHEKGEEKYKKIIEEANNKAKKIIESKEIECKELDEIFLKVKDNLGDKILEYIINS